MVARRFRLSLDRTGNVEEKPLAPRIVFPIFVDRRSIAAQPEDYAWGAMQ